MFGWSKKKRSEPGSGSDVPLIGDNPGEDDAFAAEEMDASTQGCLEEPQPASGGDSLLSQVNGICSSVSGVAADAAQVADTYRACLEINRDIEAIRSKRDVDLARIVAGFKICNEVLDKTFGERAGALEKHYQALDKALESGNNVLVIEALHGISGIVTTNPLEAFQKTVDELMDLKPGGVLELDF